MKSLQTHLQSQGRWRLSCECIPADSEKRLFTGMSLRECVTRMGGTACRVASAGKGIERMAWQQLLPGKNSVRLALLPLLQVSLAEMIPEATGSNQNHRATFRRNPDLGQIPAKFPEFLSS